MSKESAQAMLAAIPVTTPTPAGSPGLQGTDGVGVPAPKQEPLDSTRFAHLAKKETELQKQREAFKKEQEGFAAERVKALEFQTKFKEIEELKGKDLMQAMRLAGITEQDFYNYLASQEDTSSPEERATKAAANEIQKFKDEQAKIASDAQVKRNDEVISGFKKSVNTLLASDKDKYEYCNYHGPIAEDLIFETLAAVYDADSIIISAQEAAEMVESYYEEEDKAQNTLKKRGYKVPGSVLEQAPVPKEEPLKPEVSARPPSKTLSNRTAATVASTQVTRKETRSEKRERLIQTLGNLGKQ